MTGRAPFLALALLASLLAAGIALEFDAAAPAEEPAVNMPARRLPMPRPQTAAAPEAADHTDEWVETILARPLFNRDRKPTPPPASASGAAASAAKPRLTGTLVGGGERKAIFAGEGGKPVVVGVGGTIGVFTVDAIEPGLVTLTGPDGTEPLRPSFDAEARRALLAELPQGQANPAQPPQPALPGQPGQPGQPAPLNVRPGSQFQRALQAIQNVRPPQVNIEVGK